MSGTVIARRGDSLWSIARAALPLGSSEREVLEAVRLVAGASGMAVDARPRVGQTVTVPPAVDRLADRVRARPLVSPRPTWRRFERRDVRAAAIATIGGVVPTRARIVRFVGAVNDALHPDALTSLDIRFGRLRRDAFDRLVGVFGTTDTTDFRPTHDYTLLDLLPPIVRAIADVDLEVPVAQPLAGTTGWNRRDPSARKEVSLDPNCHGTAYEVLSQLQQPRSTFRVHHGEMLTMDQLVHGGGFETVAELPATALRRIGRVGLRPGDLVQFYESSEWPRATMLLHSAVHLGAGVYFDKPNTEFVGEDSPYRLGTFATVSRPVLHAVDGQARVEVLRPVAALAPAEVTFRSGFADQLAELERTSGRRIGTPIVQLLEHGMGGGISDEQLSALVEVPFSELPEPPSA